MSAPEKRFVYSHSSVYGWTVYDRSVGSSPAYDACADLLQPVEVQEDGTVITESPIMLKNEYAAMKLCMRLNGAYRRREATHH